MRKTLSVELLRQEVNTMLTDSSCDPKVREGMCAVLETALHRSGNYHGFRYLKQEELRERAKGQMPGINKVDDDEPDWEKLYRLRFENTDDTRRHYY